MQSLKKPKNKQFFRAVKETTEQLFQNKFRHQKKWKAEKIGADKG